MHEYVDRTDRRILIAAWYQIMKHCSLKLQSTCVLFFAFKYFRIIIVIIFIIIIIIIVIMLWLSRTWATCWLVPVSHIQKAVQWPFLVPSALWCLAFLLPSVICYEVFCLHIVYRFFCSPALCLNLGLYFTPLQYRNFFIICPSVSCCFPLTFQLCCCYSPCAPC